MKANLLYYCVGVFFLFNLISSRAITIIPEITDEELADLISSLRSGEYAKEHEFLLKLVLHPENYDLNKDRKISPLELKKALDWLVLPKDNELRQRVNQDVIERSLAGVELFINGFQSPMTYKQFLSVLNILRLEHLIDLERAKKNAAAAQQGMELYDDL
jgi:hypothetical protein